MTNAEASSTEALLGLAARVLDGSIRLSRVAPARTACWLARRALESLITDLLRARNVEPGTAATRSRLTCLSVAYANNPLLVTEVSTLWDQLSRTCHHHAYELTPTVGEARDLVFRLSVLEP